MTQTLEKSNPQNGHSSLALVPRAELSPEDAKVLESVVVQGDLSKLQPAQRVAYYRMRCEAAGLDVRTQPFAYITLQGKLTLYATKTATEQLCEKRDISTAITERKNVADIYTVQVRASLPSGRFTDATGAVTMGNLKGDALCNAIMKAETKAKRRAVLALCGLGMLDDTERETIEGAHTFAPEEVHAEAKSEPLANDKQRQGIQKLASRFWPSEDYPNLLETYLKENYQKTLEELTVSEAKTVYRMFEEQLANASQPETVEGEVVDSPANPRFNAFLNNVNDLGGFSRFSAACEAKGIPFATDADMAAFEKAATPKAGIAVIVEDLSDDDWQGWAAMVEAGTLSWGETE